MTVQSERRSYRFGRFRLHTTGRVLFRGDQPIPLPPKAADILLLLLQNAGNVVEKEDLLKRVWQDTFVEEGSLTRTISILRKALEDDRNGQEYIATIPKRGYRFTSPVELVEGDLQGQGPNGGTRARKHHQIRVAAIALAMGAVLAAAYFSAKQYARRSGGHTGTPMLAVLPFQNLTGDPAQEFVADGLTEEMITQLGGLGHDQLGVIARTSAMTYKGSTKPVSTIGKELGVNYVLEGSVRRWGKSIRVSVQLIQIQNQTHIWAQNYEGDAEDILKLQSDVAQAVAHEISLSLAPEARARMAKVARVDPVVYELCLRGRYEWNKRTEAGIRQGILYFQQAINKDPNYAPAYAGLADAYAVLRYYSKGPPHTSWATVKAMAEHALQLDESLAEAHTTLGFVECGQSDLVGAEHEYRRALELDPNYATAHHWRSFCLWGMNLRNEALAELERARRLDPLSLIIYSDEARTLSAVHQPDRAIQLLGTALELDPNFADAHRALAVAYVQAGQFSKAITEARRGVELDPNDYELATLGYVYGMAGKTKEARAILAELRKSGRRVDQLNLSFVYSGLGEKEQALRFLERACDEGADVRAAEPMLDPLRSDPRFQDLLRRSTKSLLTNSAVPAS